MQVSVKFADRFRESIYREKPWNRDWRTKRRRDLIAKCRLAAGVPHTRATGEIAEIQVAENGQLAR
jgi:hypothetical protein